MGRLEEGPLPGAEAERVLQLGGFAGSLGAEEDDRWIGRDDSALIAGEEVARVLRGEDERPVVLADAPREADDEAPNRDVFEEQAQLVDDEEATAIPAFDAGP